MNLGEKYNDLLNKIEENARKRIEAESMNSLKRQANKERKEAIAKGLIDDGIIEITAQNQNLINSGWKNKEGTSKRCDSQKCSCGSRKDHWNECGGKKHNKTFDNEDCANLNCPNKETSKGEAKHGAHVYNYDLFGSSIEWIVPFCVKCNLAEDGKVFTLKMGTILVRAAKAETCES